MVDFDLFFQRGRLFTQFRDWLGWPNKAGDNRFDQRHPDFGEFVFYLFLRGSSLGLRKVTPAGPVKVTWTITSVFSVHV
jgi:hypothetical protein